MTEHKNIPSVSVDYACDGSSRTANELSMRAMQERAYDKRGEQYLLIKSPPTSGKSQALMFITLDKLHHQGLSGKRRSNSDLNWKGKYLFCFIRDAIQKSGQSISGEVWIEVDFQHTGSLRKQE